MTTGVGTDVALGFAIETTENTRIAPDTFLEILSESLTHEKEWILSQGLGGGRAMHRRKTAGMSTAGGSVAVELRTAAMADLLRLCIGGDPAVTGTDPYTRVFTGGGDLPSATFQKLVPHDPTTKQAFDFVGSKVNSWTLSQNPNEFANFQLEVFSKRCVTDQSAATFAPPASPGLLTFQHATVTTPDDEICFDSFTLTGNNALERQGKVCSGGEFDIRPGGRRTVEGTLSGDFTDMDAYNRYIAGTEGTLTVSYSLSASASITIAMNMAFTGETPTVNGAGVVKQGIPFMALSETSDADALTVTLVNDEA